MDFLRIFHAAALLGLGAAGTGCGQGQPSAGPAGAEAGHVVAAVDAKVAAERLDGYIGAVFSQQQQALSLKAPEPDAPGF